MKGGKARDKRDLANCRRYLRKQWGKEYVRKIATASALIRIVDCGNAIQIARLPSGKLLLNEPIIVEWLYQWASYLQMGPMLFESKRSKK